MTSRDSLQRALSMSTTSSGPTVFSTLISWLQASRMLGNSAFMFAVLKAVATAFLHKHSTVRALCSGCTLGMLSNVALLTDGQHHNIQSSNVLFIGLSRVQRDEQDDDAWQLDTLTGNGLGCSRYLTTFHLSVDSAVSSVGRACGPAK